MTIWATSPPAFVPIKKLRLASLFLCPITPEETFEFDVPSSLDLKAVQTEKRNCFGSEKKDMKNWSTM